MVIFFLYRVNDVKIMPLGLIKILWMVYEISWAIAVLLTT